MQIGTNIKTLRTQKNLSQKQLAYKLGVTSVYLSMIENNAKVPSFNLLERMTRILEIPMVLLLSETAFA